MNSLQKNQFALKHLTPDLKDKLYADIYDFRTTFNLPVQSGKLEEASDELHTSLAVEELTEMAEATDIIEVLDSICDTVYVAVGRTVEYGSWIPAIEYLVELMLSIAHAKGLDFVRGWDEVHRSNMSKTAKTTDEVKENIEHYAQFGIEIDVEEKCGVYLLKNAKECIYKGKPLKVGKVLKSKFYSEADLSFAKV